MTYHIMDRLKERMVRNETFHNQVRTDVSSSRRVSDCSLHLRHAVLCGCMVHLETFPFVPGPDNMIAYFSINKGQICTEYNLD
jgi:hypothetical protein